MTDTFKKIGIGQGSISTAHEHETFILSMRNMAFWPVKDGKRQRKRGSSAVQLDRMSVSIPSLKGANNA